LKEHGFVFTGTYRWHNNNNNNNSETNKSNGGLGKNDSSKIIKEFHKL